jgi:N-acetylmuramoyl-L-alanine amidase
MFAGRFFAALSLGLVCYSSHAQLIALDVGHSLAKPGAISSRGVPEFEFNRALALELESTLKASGLHATLIAIDGLTQDLASRPRRAREAGAQLFVSVHHDSARERFLRDWTHEGAPRRYLDDRFRGFSIFISRHQAAWPQSLKCASAFGEALRRAGFNPSRYHADPVLGANREFADEANGVHFYDQLAVLRGTAMPAFLFEAGVILNRTEETMMAMPETRSRIANALASSVPACLIATHRAKE